MDESDVKQEKIDGAMAGSSSSNMMESLVSSMLKAMQTQDVQKQKYIPRVPKN